MVVSNAPTPETLENLVDNKIDFGVVSTPFESRNGIEVMEVKEIEDVFVAGRRFLPYKNRMLDLQELERIPIICLEGKTSTRTYIDGFLWDNGVRIRPEFELATSNMIVQFALRNLGVGCVMREFAREYLDSGTLFELRFNKIIPKRQFCVVTNTKVPLSAATANMLRLLQEEATERKNI